MEAVSSPEPKEALYEMWQEAVRNGTIDGVKINPDDLDQTIAALEDAFGETDIENTLISVDQLRKDFTSLSEIIKKAPKDLTLEQLQLLENYPQLFEDLMQGTIGSLDSYFTVFGERIQESIDNQRQAINLSKTALQIELEMGRITQDQFEAEMDLLSVQENSLDVASDILDFSDAEVNALKDQINAYKSAFAEAKKIRDLQKESAEITQKSIDAIRTGATGTIEAEFNRTRLNQEIADANRALQENMLIAQLEAQQKVLEDAQQRKIQKATEDNTTALGKTKQSLDDLAAVMRAIMEGRRSVTIETTAGPVTIDPFEFFNIQSDLNN